jgi:amylosucrase
VLVIGNFNVAPQPLPLDTMKRHGFCRQGSMKDLYSNSRIEPVDDAIVIPALSFFWLAD